MSNRKKNQNSSQVYAAECILDTKKERGRTLYLIKWSGWSSKYNTWEPRKNILDNRLIEAYEKKKKLNIKKDQIRQAVELLEQKDEKLNNELDNDSDELKTEVKLINGNIDYDDQTSNFKDYYKRAEFIHNLKNVKEFRNQKLNKTELNKSNQTDAIVKRIEDEEQSDDSTELSDLNNNDVQNKNINKEETRLDFTDSINSLKNKQTDKEETTNNDEDDDLNDSYESNLIIDTTIDDESNSHDGTINDSLNGSLKRKIEFDSSDFNRKLCKYQHDYENQIKINNDKSNQIENNRCFESNNLHKLINNDKDNSIYSSDNSNFLNRNEFNQDDTNCANKLINNKSMKPDFLKRKSNLLDLVTVTDVTSNNETVTIRESKSHKFFFKDNKKSANQQCL